VVCGAASIAMIAVLAALTKSPLVFPPLGALAYIAFAHPLSRPARPREIVLGLGLGLAAGSVAALAFGLHGAGIDELDTDWRHVGSASVALALTTAGLIVARIEQPVACAAALLVAIGVWEGWQVGVLAGGVLVFVLLAIAINRAAGLPYPLWARRPDVSEQRR
jgi:CBS-domain-containing membrane protein